MPSGDEFEIEDRDHRDVQRVRLRDRDRLLVRVDDEQDVGQPAHLLDAAERALELVAVARQLQQFALGQAALLGGDALVELPQPADRLGDRLEVGQHAAEPAVVDVILAAALGCLGDRLLRLALGADEQHAAARRNDVADRLQALVHHRHGLLEVDDVDPVARAKDVGRHFRVPAARVVAEMDTGFEQLAQRISRQHVSVPFPVGPPQEKIGAPGHPETPTPERPPAHARAAHNPA